MIISSESTPAIFGYKGAVPCCIAKAELLPLTKHIALECCDKNIKAYAVVLGDIFTDAIFSSKTLTKRKKTAMENLMRRCDDPKEVATPSASIASEDFAFVTVNTTVIQDGKVLL